MARNNITFEACTLVYTLLDESQLNFDDFSLIVRSLHSYMVDEIKENPEMKNVHVKLGYQASLINAQNKLGALRNIVGISKLSSHVKESEFSRLEQLRQQFGLSNPEYEQSQPRGRGGTRQRLFQQRPRPYRVTPAPCKKLPRIQTIQEEPEENDTLPDAQPWGIYPSTSTQQSPEYYSENQ